MTTAEPSRSTIDWSEPALESGTVEEVRGHPVPDRGCLQGGQRSVLVMEITSIFMTLSRKGRRCGFTSARDDNSGGI